ncbi:MAG: GNAT family N-acetyltransferase [Planctomycetes bacterium]|nr:GNAT family N-acetyltransferase [Planctomycetota bacterium]
MIRDATRADLQRLRELFLQARRETFHWTDPALFRLEDFDLQTEGESLLLAEMDGTIAGFISWWPPENFVHHLYVDSAFKRRGIGRALLDTVLESLDGPARLKCQTRNEQAVRFYKARGWRILEEGVSEDGPHYLMQSPGLASE